MSTAVSRCVCRSEEQLTSVSEEPLNNYQRHVDSIVLVPNGIEGDGVDPGDICAHDLVDSVPDEETLASHRVRLNLGGIRPEDRIRKVENGKVEPDEDDGSDRSRKVGFASLGIHTT